MKFSLKTISKCSGRVGQISDFESLPGVLMDTPVLFLHTKGQTDRWAPIAREYDQGVLYGNGLGLGGTWQPSRFHLYHTEGGVIPHLTQETFEMVSKDRHVLSASVESTLQCLTSSLQLKKTLADFIGMKEYPIFCGVHNTAIPINQGYNGKLQVSIWTKSGRETLDADRYMDVIEAFKPDLYQFLCDGDTQRNSTKKRLEKSIESTYEFYKTCRSRHNKSTELKHSMGLAVLVGGYDLNYRANSARHVGREPVAGFVIDGLNANGSLGESLTTSEISPLVMESLKHIPSESFRMAPGCWSPELVWQLVKLGIDAFDSSLPSVAAERGAALTFQFDPETASFQSDSPIPVQDGEALPKLNYEINLHELRYKEVLKPILDGCKCLTCQNHTKAYVHHLMITQELLGPVLLMIHNLHHYLEFFKQIRKAIQLAASNHA